MVTFISLVLPGIDPVKDAHRSFPTQICGGGGGDGTVPYLGLLRLVLSILPSILRKTTNFLKIKHENAIYFNDISRLIGEPYVSVY